MSGSQNGNAFFSNKNTNGTNPFSDGEFTTITVSGNAVVGGNTSIGGTLTVVGNTTLNGLTNNGNETIAGSLDVTGTSGFTSLFANTINVVSNLFLDGDLTVTG